MPESVSRSPNLSQNAWTQSKIIIILSNPTVDNLFTRISIQNENLLHFGTPINTYIIWNEKYKLETLRHRNQQFQQRSSYFNLSPATSTICLAALIHDQVTIKLYFILNSLTLYQIACSCIRLHDSVSDVTQINKCININKSVSECLNLYQNA